MILQLKKKADVLDSSLGTWEINGLSLEIRSWSDNSLAEGFLRHDSIQR